ncbi:5'-phosphoribosyl-monophospho-decaprenol phosphatase [Actinopolyspora mzabensis]|uniref:5'-phosphoribosyl-monophospho-decaprenol phosphatase n=1 Tax=Actinopolyspora mzabensis TaxID=995066 RepID=A0A1G9AP94_ACTMZ|nr:phosphatase PAP2 family protein [Actinopolyspora mzabensis]SDK29152.1 5'-phosphoribosyl-monophospho-decaprenol phosphatase [Actinopolyspora mzabensis]
MDAELTTVAAEPIERIEPEQTTEERMPAAVTAETTAVRRVQHVLATPPVVTVAKGMSKFGDHALGWLALGAVGALTDRRRRREWVLAAAGVAVSHGASIAVKRVVRRNRPGDPGIRVLVDTPSRLSFPSSHATSTTTAAILYGRLLGRGLGPVVVPPMMVSRLVLGVHYPSDVLVGSGLGGTVALGVRRYVERRRNRG